MANSRYSNTRTIFPGNYYGTSSTVASIRAALEQGTLSFRTRYTTGNERLDTIAAQEYGDGRYWWVVAAASDIGWGMQVPPGVYLRLPNINEVMVYLG